MNNTFSAVMYSTGEHVWTLRLPMIATSFYWLSLAVGAGYLTLIALSFCLSVCLSVCDVGPHPNCRGQRASQHAPLKSFYELLNIWIGHSVSTGVLTCIRFAACILLSLLGYIESLSFVILRSVKQYGICFTVISRLSQVCSMHAFRFGPMCLAFHVVMCVYPHCLGAKRVTISVTVTCHRVSLNREMTRRSHGRPRMTTNDQIISRLDANGSVCWNLVRTGFYNEIDVST